THISPSLLTSLSHSSFLFVFFFFTDPAPTELSPLSLHDALPILTDERVVSHIITIGEDITEWKSAEARFAQAEKLAAIGTLAARSEEHTSELQSLTNLVCRLLLEKKTTCHPPDIQSRLHYQLPLL